MKLGLPGTWLARGELEPGDKPAHLDAGCGCHQPRIWDGRAHVWRHLNDGTPCVPAIAGGEAP